MVSRSSNRMKNSSLELQPLWYYGFLCGVLRLAVALTEMQFSAESVLIQREIIPFQLRVFNHISNGQNLPLSTYTHSHIEAIH